MAWRSGRRRVVRQDRDPDGRGAGEYLGRGIGARRQFVTIRKGHADLLSGAADRRGMRREFRLRGRGFVIACVAGSSR